MMRRGPASVAGEGSRERMAAVRRPSRTRTSPARSVTVASGARLGPERSASLSGRNSPTSRETDDAASEVSRSISGFARTTRIPLLSPERRIGRKHRACVRRPDSGRLELSAPASDECVRGSYVLAKVERAIGCESEPAVRRVRRRSKSADETVFEPHSNEDTITQSGRSPKQKF